MSVVKATVDRYTIHKDGEWAKVYVESGKNDHGEYRWGSLSIISSFGNFGAHWGAIGAESFGRFLASLDSDYALKNLTSCKHMIFDPDETVAKFKEQVISRRKRGHLEKDDAREVFDALVEIEEERFLDEGVFCERLSSTAGQAFWQTDLYMEGTEHRLSPQCAGLWKLIWPELIAAMNPKVPA